MEQKSIIQEESLEGVIKTVKDLIAQLDIKIKRTTKVAQPIKENTHNNER
ncbi:MAG: hypothetical protein KAQ89_05430 [Planctomycetes bacterium]|nr:hypothetical protein [Planctomycetota bacterium]